MRYGVEFTWVIYRTEVRGEEEREGEGEGGGEGEEAGKKELSKEGRKGAGCVCRWGWGG